MRKQISIVIVIGLIVFSLIAVVAKSDTEIRLQQLDLKTKNQEIDIKDNKLEALQVELDKAKGDSKELERIQKEFDKLKAENEALQAKKAEEQRLAQAQASNVAQASSQQVSAPVGDIEQIIRSAAVKHGLDSDWFVNLARCESGLDGSAVNYGYYENGHPSGLFQHISGYWAARAAAHGYAGASVFDPVANANVTASMWKTGSHLWECQ